MKKSILVLDLNYVYAISSVGTFVQQIENTKNTEIDIHNRTIFFEENEKEIFNKLNDLEFKFNEFSFFEVDSGPYINLIQSLENYNVNPDVLKPDDLVNYWGSYLYTGMGTSVVGLRVQYIKVKKPIIVKSLKVFDTEEDWTFTFSTYQDDLVSLAYDKALSKLKQRYNLQNLKTSYSNEDLVKMIDIELEKNPKLISKKNKVERNMLDFKNKHSVYIRLDQNVITEEDIENCIKRFKLKNYSMFN